jgi:hypothetical protein
MDLSRALSYITDDEDWLKKLAIGGLLSLIPVVGQFWAGGYALQVLKNIIAGKESPLPELTDDFGDKLIHGLVVWAITTIYALPMIVLGIFAGIVIGLITAPMDSDVAGVVSALTGTCAGLIGLVFFVAYGLFYPYVLGAYAETGQFGDAFQFSKIWTMVKANIGQTLLTLLVMAVVGAVAGSIGAAVCGIGAAFTGFYAQLVSSFLYGKLYSQTKAKTV